MTPTNSFAHGCVFTKTDRSNLGVASTEVFHASLNRLKSVESRALFPKLVDISPENRLTAA